MGSGELLIAAPARAIRAAWREVKAEQQPRTVAPPAVAPRTVAEKSSPSVSSRKSHRLKVRAREKHAFLNQSVLNRGADLKLLGPPGAWLYRLGRNSPKHYGHRWGPATTPLGRASLAGLDSAKSHRRIAGSEHIRSLRRAPHDDLVAGSGGRRRRAEPAEVLSLAARIAAALMVLFIGTDRRGVAEPAPAAKAYF